MLTLEISTFPPRFAPFGSVSGGAVAEDVCFFSVVDFSPLGAGTMQALPTVRRTSQPRARCTPLLYKTDGCVRNHLVVCEYHPCSGRRFLPVPCRTASETCCLLHSEKALGRCSCSSFWRFWWLPLCFCSFAGVEREDPPHARSSNGRSHPHRPRSKSSSPRPSRRSPN